MFRVAGIGCRIFAAVAFAFGAVIIRADAVAADTMRFRNECYANAAETCFVIAEGKLDPGAPDRFEKLFSEWIEGYQVLLNSSGGNLNAGLKLGRAIRARDLHTVIGRWNDDDNVSFEEKLEDAECLSACSYAFLGGVTRTIPLGNRIGFHQFILPGGELLKGPGGLSSGQQISALLISYLVEMGVDARLFGLATSAASDKMFFPTPDQLVDHDVVTPSGFDHFFLEPYEAGIVAGSKRLDATRAYDLVTNLTAFCRDGVARFLLTTESQHGITAEMSVLEAGVRFSSSKVTPIELTADRVRTWATDKAGFIELSLTQTEVERLFQAKEMTVHFFSTRASGGSYKATVRLNKMDRKMLAAAFRFCI